MSAVSPPPTDLPASESTAQGPSPQSNFQSPGQGRTLQETVEPDTAEKPTAAEPPQDMSRLFYEYSRREFETLETLGIIDRLSFLISRTFLTSRESGRAGGK